MGFHKVSLLRVQRFVLPHRVKKVYIYIYMCKCKSLHFNRYSFLDWTLPPAPVASGWKVQEEFPAWKPAGTNSVFFKLTGMRDWHFSLWVTSKAKRGKHVNSLDELIWFKSSLSWCVSFLGTFTSAFVLLQFSRWRMYSWRMYSWKMCMLVFYAEHGHK